MEYMLDTNICIYLIKKKPPKVLERLSGHEVSEVGVSVVTLSELEFGVQKSQQKERNGLALVQFLAPLEIAYFDEHAARQYGVLRAELENKGRPLGALDMLIAAHARALGAVLVTNNTREFRRVPELTIENWTR